MAEAIVRLACVRHAASVRSEPGSNSQVDLPAEPAIGGLDPSQSHHVRAYSKRCVRLNRGVRYGPLAACASLPSSRLVKEHRGGQPPLQSERPPRSGDGLIDPRRGGGQPLFSGFRPRPRRRFGRRCRRPRRKRRLPSRALPDITLKQRTSRVEGPAIPCVCLVRRRAAAATDNRGRSLRHAGTERGAWLFRQRHLRGCC